MNDITPAIQTFLSYMVECFGIIYETLDSIHFLGVSLLDFFITVFLCSCIFPLILTLLRTRPVESRNSSKNNKGDSD